MEVLVIGAGGFVGSHIARLLLEKGHGVILPKAGFDITAPKTYALLPKNADAIVNAAAYIPAKDTALEFGQCMEVNCSSLAYLASYAKAAGAKKIVHSSSASVYGRACAAPVPESAQMSPELFYPISKMCGEFVLSACCKEAGIRLAMLRYPSVYGPGMKQATVLPKFIAAARKNETITLVGKGGRTQDFLHAKDAAAANALALSKSASGVFNIGSGQETSMAQLAKEAILATGSKGKIEFLGQEAESRFYLDISKAKRELGYNPAYDLKRGLLEYAESLKGAE